LQACIVYYAQDQQGWVFLIYFCSCFHAKCNILLHLSDRINNAVLLVSHWKVQLNYILLTIGLQVYHFCAIGMTKKCAFVFNNHVLLPVMRSDKTWNVLETVVHTGGSFITLLQSCNRQIKSSKSFFDKFHEKLGSSVCHSWFDYSVSVAHLHCCVIMLGRRRGIFFKRNSSQWLRWYFYDFKEMPVWGWSRNTFCSKNCCGSIAPYY
jgi:hypothetical protein